MLWAASNYFSFDSFFSIALPSKRLSFSPKPIAWSFPRSPDRRRREKWIPITQTLNKKKKKKRVLEKKFSFTNYWICRIPNQGLLGDSDCIIFLRKCRLSNDLHLFLLICLKKKSGISTSRSYRGQGNSKKKMNIGEELAEGSRDQGKAGAHRLWAPG